MQGHDTTLWLDNTQQGQVFSIPYVASPTSVTFDADGWILCYDKNGEVSANYNSSTAFEAGITPASGRLKCLFPKPGMPMARFMILWGEV
jgi:hypothetical protein